MRKALCMSTTYKFILDKRRKKPDCIYSLKLRVYHSDGNKEHDLKIALHEKDWDERSQSILKSDSNYKANSYILTNAKAKLERRLLLSSEEEEELTAEALITSLIKQKTKKSTITFLEYSNNLILDMIEAGKAGNAMAYKDAVNSIISFTKDPKIKLEDISYSLLDKYNTSMLAKGVKVNSIAAYLRSVRAIYNKAIKAEIVSENYYPFRKFKIDTEKTPSRKLSIEEMRSIYSLKLFPGTPIWHYRNYFMLSFYLIGVNFADLFTIESDNLVSGRLEYSRDKTGRLYSIGIHEEAKRLLDYYRVQSSNNNHKYVLPLLTVANNSLQKRKNIKLLIHNCNAYLASIAKACGIHKPITTYYARYSWANIAKTLGYSKDIIAEALGHQYGNAVTGIYLDDYDTDIIDKANSVVIASIVNTQQGD